jgi:ribosomal protein S14
MLIGVKIFEKERIGKLNKKEERDSHGKGIERDNKRGRKKYNMHTLLHLCRSIGFLIAHTGYPQQVVENITFQYLRSTK